MNQNKPFHLLLFLSYKIYRIKYTTQSQADGYEEFNQLQPANDYETRITFEGFRPLVWMLFRFNWENTKLDFSLFLKYKNWLELK
jgi:hypothetical protein